ncbi:cytochrome bd oxidase small subunit CydS [Alkalicoccus luteus]|uniref:Uncharacterized protein n=1 Tax=Alkalicoccus luteus TaxID=1237094 RepID=A0A969PLY7_9BACI|nr:hypothetical protein [Alkalicoccus luteus]NJP36627.1 hypothetical protein [Alkalicoccus luteus]
MTDFLIFWAPQLVLVACVVLVFLWAAKGKEPAFVQNAEAVTYSSEEEAEASAPELHDKKASGS